MASEIQKAIEAICHEKGLNYDEVLEALELALAAAYRKDFGHKQQNLKVKYDVETGDMQVWDVKEVVEDIDEEKLLADQEELSKRREAAREEERELSEEEIEDLVKFNPKTEMMITEAKTHKKTAKLGDILEIEQEVPGDFGRMAAQTAKQVIIQKVREAERNAVFADFEENAGTIVQGTIQKRDRSGLVIVDLGRINGLLQPEDQIAGEFYRPGLRMRFFVKSVAMGERGPQILLSRASSEMVMAVLEQEIPEIESGEVVVKGIARDAGYRAKVAVHTDDEAIDPIGACIGQRGSRITTIIEELGGEKVDVIQYKEDAESYIKEALSPAKVENVELNEEEKEAVVHVEDDQFSLAIGKNGQNVRLASELTGWKIDVISDSSDAQEPEQDLEKESSEEEVEEKESVATEAAPETEEAPEVTEETPAEEEKDAASDDKEDAPAEETVEEDDKK